MLGLIYPGGQEGLFEEVTLELIPEGIRKDNLEMTIDRKERVQRPADIWRSRKEGPYARPDK